MELNNQQPILIDANDKKYNIKINGEEFSFGEKSFYSTEYGFNLIDDIFDEIEKNNIILLHLGDGYYYLAKYTKLASFRSCYFIGERNNFYDLSEVLPNKEINETENEYQDKCNNFIFNNFKFGGKYILFIKDEESEPNVFYSFIQAANQTRI